MIELFDRFLMTALGILIGVTLLAGGLAVAVSNRREQQRRRRREALAELARRRQGRFVDASHPALAQDFQAFSFFSHCACETTARNHLVLRCGKMIVGCFDFDYRVRSDGDVSMVHSYRTSVVYVDPNHGRLPRGLVRRRRRLDWVARHFERWTERTTGNARFDRCFCVFSDHSLETLVGRPEVAEFLLQWNPRVSIEFSGERIALFRRRQIEAAEIARLLAGAEEFARRLFDDAWAGGAQRLTPFPGER